MYPGVVGAGVVTLTRTSVTPVSGTPPTPVTFTRATCPPLIGPTWPSPDLVSTMRAAGTEWKTLPGVPSVLENQPARSTITSTVPKRLYSDTAPFDPTPIMIRLARVCPATKLETDDAGRADPEGHAVRKLASEGFVTV